MLSRDFNARVETLAFPRRFSRPRVRGCARPVASVLAHARAPVSLSLSWSHLNFAPSSLWQFPMKILDFSAAYRENWTWLIVEIWNLATSRGRICKQHLMLCVSSGLVSFALHLLTQSDTRLAWVIILLSRRIADPGEIRCLPDERT